MKPYEKLLAHWRSDGIDPAPCGATEADVAALEKRYSIVLPEDFRDYLLRACALSDGQIWDQHNTEWWHSERLRSIPEEYEHEVANQAIRREADKYLFFADHSIWCWAWAINCGEGPDRGGVVVIGGRDRLVANSFADFVDRYLADPWALSA